MDDCQVIQVVRTRLLRRGRGTQADPVRVIEQYWSLDGVLLWERDHWRESGPTDERKSAS